MKSYNLYFLSQLEDDRLFGQTEAVLAGRQLPLTIKNHERRSVKGLVDLLFPLCPSPEYFDGFAFSYTIPHIGKEFDLLKITDLGVLNIELKSTNVGRKNIREQLTKNKYYLSHLSLPITTYTYVLKTDRFYGLNEKNELVNVSKHEVALSVMIHTVNYRENFDELFKACEYLISPIATPERFLSGSYFLTQHQQYAKNRILSRIESGKRYVAISGSPGTGKTLLLYDLCKELSGNRRCLFLYPDHLEEGHHKISSALPMLDIKSLLEIDIAQIILNDYHVIFIDEANRLEPMFFDQLIALSEKNHIPLLMTHEEGLAITKEEMEEKIAERIANLPRIERVHLSNTIRANEDLLYFISVLFEQKLHRQAVAPQNVSLFYVPEQSLAASMQYYAHLDYESFDFRSVNKINSFCAGTEYEKALVVLDGQFYYNNAKKLCYREKDGILVINRLKRTLLKVREQAVILVTDLELYRQLLVLFSDKKDTVNAPTLANKKGTVKKKEN